MNEIAAKLGEVGLPAPISELAPSDWDAVIVGGGHNGLTAAAYLAKAGQTVLVLERRERLGGACTLERPFADQRYSVSPCAYVVGLLDELVIKELQLTPARLRVLRRRPQPVGPVRGRHELRPVARRRQDPAQPRGAQGLQEGHRRLLGLRAPLRRDPPAPAHPRARHAGSARRPTREEIEDLLHGEQDDDRHRLQRLDRRRPRRLPRPTSGSRTRSSARA